MKENYLHTSAKSVFRCNFIYVAFLQIASLLFFANVSAQCPGMTAPSAILGDDCTIWGTGLSISGGSLGSHGIYQWGTGNVAGQNIFASGQWTTTQWVNPAVQTTYWLRIYNTQTGCATSAVFKTITKLSTPPTHIEWIAPVCSGAPFTLKALGGANGTNTVFQWGTGSVGSNIIASQTGSIGTFTVTGNTTFWVRRFDGAPCNTYTDARTFNVTVMASSNAPTAPTSLTSSATLPLCTGGTTLTASGGSMGANGTYQWGTGAVPANIISGATSASLSVNPSVTTSYWVRRIGGSPCAVATTAKSITVTVTKKSTSPTAINGTNLICKGSSTVLSPAGGTMGSNATYQWGIGTTVGSGSVIATTPTLTVTPLTTTTYWVRRRDNGTCVATTGGVTLTVTVAIPSTAPTTLTADTTGCAGENITLTAAGGISGSNSTYQWGTGAIGYNIIPAQSAANITVAPNGNTTYWVRRIDAAPCSATTGAATLAITVAPATVAGTLSSAVPVICKNTRPNDITLTGNTGSVIKWQSSNNADFTGNVINIASTSTTLQSSMIDPLSTTSYFRAVVQNGNCNIVNTAPIAITVPAPVTYTSSGWSTTPQAVSSVIITADMTLTSSLDVCSCRIAGTATLTIADGVSLTVQNDLFVTPNASIIVENNGSLVQIDDSAVNTGEITVKRNSAPMKNYDFTYWSSPVQGVTLHNLSPNTLFDKYYSFNPMINNWVIIPNGTSIMAPAKGYIVRAPQGWALNNESQGVFNGEFTGTPNNGTIQASIKKGAGTLNLIGNPYPSAIDIDLFLLDPANENIIKGTVYLWTHNTAISSSNPGNGASNYTSDDYAKYNITGGIKTASAALTGIVEPTGKIASGQAFFIEANPSLAAGSYNATFNNSMRIQTDNNQFFRPGAGSTQTLSAIEKHRVWLNITNTQGAYAEMLLGYIQGATDNLDNRYDGAIMPAGNVVGLYSLLDAEKLAIQGRSLPFNANDVIPMGYHSNLAGNFTIGLENLDGLFENQDVYLVDNTNNSYHNLKQSAYSFATLAGTFENRFELRFTNGTLGTSNPSIVENDIIVITNAKHVSITSGNYTMEAVEIFDLTGKLIYQKDAINANTFDTSQLNAGSQVVLVRVTFDNNQTLSKKIVLN